MSTGSSRPAMKDGIIKRGSTWSYVIRERDPKTGKTRPRWFGGFPTRTAAKKARDKARSDVARGTYVPPTTLTVAQWLDQWLEGHAIELKPSTIHAYQQKIDSYLKPAIGGDLLQGLSPARLSVVFKRMAESGGQGGRPLSPRSVQYARSILRKACNVAVVNRILEVNPVTGSTAPRVEKKRKHDTWTGEQQAKFLQATQESRWYPLWVLALATGMRRGELCGLTWDDVDLDAGVIAVERSATSINGEIVATAPKNHERRKITIDKTTLAVLKKWRALQASEQLAWGSSYEDGNHVAAWENGRLALPDFISKRFVMDQEGHGLPRLTLHGTRHTHATTLLREGVPVHIVAKRLGHRDPSVTLDVYADAIPDDDTRAVEVFSKAVWR